MAISTWKDTGMVSFFILREKTSLYTQYCCTIGLLFLCGAWLNNTEQRAWMETSLGCKPRQWAKNKNFYEFNRRMCFVYDDNSMSWKFSVWRQGKKILKSAGKWEGIPPNSLWQLVYVALIRIPSSYFFSPFKVLQFKTDMNSAISFFAECVNNNTNPILHFIFVMQIHSCLKRPSSWPSMPVRSVKPISREMLQNCLVCKVLMKANSFLCNVQK